MALDQRRRLDHIERIRQSHEAGTEEIYVLLGKTSKPCGRLHNWRFREEGVGVLLLVDHVDEFVLGALQSYDDKKVTDVARER